MFCPCCAGRAIDSTDPMDERGKSDGKGRSTASEQFGIHRTWEDIERELLGAPLPVIANLPAEFIRHRLPDWIYNARIQRHAIWARLSLNQICTGYAERLLLDSDGKLSHLYLAEEVFGGAGLVFRTRNG